MLLPNLREIGFSEAIHKFTLFNAYVDLHTLIDTNPNTKKLELYLGKYIKQQHLMFKRLKNAIIDRAALAKDIQEHSNGNEK